MNSWRQLDLLKRGKTGRFLLAKKPPPAPEFKTHCALADTLRISISTGWLWTHFPSGEKRETAAGARLKRMGLKPGFFDFLLIDPTGRHFWLELKRGNAPLTTEQLAFLDAMVARKVPVAVARSYEAALEQLKAWGAVKTSLKVAA